MKKGLLWFDDSAGIDLDEKVNQAACRYQEKFEAVPNVCCVHPSTIGGSGEQQVGQVRVIASPTVLRHHFFVGCEDISQEMAG